MKREYSGLEILRFLCAVSVLVWHYQHFFMLTPDQLPFDFHREVQPFYSELGYLYIYGHYGVEIFFEISGFIFFWKYKDDIHSGRVNSWRFFILRFSRLYPLHFATLIFVAIFQWGYISRNGISFVYPYNDSYHFILNLVFASHWGLQKGFSYNAPIWSVSLEVIAYAVFFIGARLSKLSLMHTFCILISVYAIEKVVYPGNDIFQCLRYFFIGGGIYLVGKKSENIAVKYRVPFLLLIVLSSLYCFLSFVGKAQALSFALFSSGLLALFSMVESAIKGINIAKYASVFGNLTYSSYLCHFPIQLVLVSITDALAIDRTIYLRPLVFMTFIVGTLVVSHLVYRYFETTAQARIRAIWS